ncbi:MULTISPECIES: class F sortase [Microbacterium]|uniref:Class F sortase n=1 Tax=Microbacterium mcarthurae TaxID=3035918 RepID=A0ABW9GHG7_9MICO
MIPTPRGAQRNAPAGRPRRAACALTLAAVWVCAGCAVAPTAAGTAPTTSGFAPTITAPAPAPSQTPLLEKGHSTAIADPARVVIPGLGLDEPLIELGLAEDGAMEVPVDYDEVGWFTGGGRPGGTGPTVIAAHVDSPTGPAVFRYLEDVSVGDVVEVHDAAGRVHAYRVTETADYPKAQFPTARVFGATARDELRVITCGGIFDRGAGSYLDNRVVFAERV